MLIIDKIPKADLSVNGMIDRLLRTLIEGLRQPRPQRQRRSRKPQSVSVCHAGRVTLAERYSSSPPMSLEYLAAAN
jgi:hypothetical protein